MASRTLSPPRPGREPHRVKVVAITTPVPLSPIRGVDGQHGTHNAGVGRPLLSRWQRARIEAEVERLIGLLDAADAPFADLELDHEGEAEPDEVSAQPVTLVPDRASALIIAFPRRQRRAVVA